jgi:hypothetical protein
VWEREREREKEREKERGSVNDVYLNIVRERLRRETVFLLSMIPVTFLFSLSVFSTDFGRKTFDRPTFDRPTFGRPTFGRPAFDQPAFGRHFFVINRFFSLIIVFLGQTLLQRWYHKGLG